MKIKSFPCHGWVIDRTELRRGEIINDKVMSSNYFTVMEDGSIQDAGIYHWFMASGNNTHENIALGTVSEQTRGWNTKDSPLPAGDYLLTVREPCVVWCFNNTANETLPDFDFHHVKMDEGYVDHTFNDGDKIFMFDGGFMINGREVTGPRQITFVGTKQVTFHKDSMWIRVRG